MHFRVWGGHDIALSSKNDGCGEVGAEVVFTILGVGLETDGVGVKVFRGGTIEEDDFFSLFKLVFLGAVIEADDAIFFADVDAVSYDSDGARFVEPVTEDGDLGFLFVGSREGRIFDPQNLSLSIRRLI